MGGEHIRRLYTCNYEISKEWTVLTFKVPKALVLLPLTDNGHIHQHIHMFTAGMYLVT